MEGGDTDEVKNPPKPENLPSYTSSLNCEEESDCYEVFPSGNYTAGSQFPSSLFPRARMHRIPMTDAPHNSGNASGIPQSQVYDNSMPADNVIGGPTHLNFSQTPQIEQNFSHVNSNVHRLHSNRNMVRRGSNIPSSQAATESKEGTNSNLMLNMVNNAPPTISNGNFLRLGLGQSTEAIVNFHKRCIGVSSQPNAVRPTTHQTTDDPFTNIVSDSSGRMYLVRRDSYCAPQNFLTASLEPPTNAGFSTILSQRLNATQNEILGRNVGFNSRLISQQDLWGSPHRLDTSQPDMHHNISRPRNMDVGLGFINGGRDMVMRDSNHVHQISTSAVSGGTTRQDISGLPIHTNEGSTTQAVEGRLFPNNGGPISESKSGQLGGGGPVRRPKGLRVPISTGQVMPVAKEGSRGQKSSKRTIANPPPTMPLAQSRRIEPQLSVHPFISTPAPAPAPAPAPVPVPVRGLSVHPFISAPVPVRGRPSLTPQLKVQPSIPHPVATISVPNRQKGLEELLQPMGVQCSICKRDVTFTSEGPVFQPAIPPMVAVLPCGHASHDSCLARITPADQSTNPPCIPCAISDS